MTDKRTRPLVGSLNIATLLVKRVWMSDPSHDTIYNFERWRLASGLTTVVNLEYSSEYATGKAQMYPSVLPLCISLPHAANSVPSITPIYSLSLCARLSVPPLDEFPFARDPLPSFNLIPDLGAGCGVPTLDIGRVELPSALSPSRS